MENSDDEDWTCAGEKEEEEVGCIDAVVTGAGSTEFESIIMSSHGFEEEVILTSPPSNSPSLSLSFSESEMFATSRVALREERGVEGLELGGRGAWGGGRRWSSLSGGNGCLSVEGGRGASFFIDTGGSVVGGGGRGRFVLGGGFTEGKGGFLLGGGALLGGKGGIELGGGPLGGKGGIVSGWRLLGGKGGREFNALARGGLLLVS